MPTCCRSIVRVSAELRQLPCDREPPLAGTAEEDGEDGAAPAVAAHAAVAERRPPPPTHGASGSGAPLARAPA